MHAQSSSRFRLLLTLLAFVYMLAPLCEAQSVMATWSQGTLSLTMTYRAPRAGAGKLIVELLSPEDEVLAKSECLVEATGRQDAWKQTLTVPHSIPFNQLVWERVRWRFQYVVDAAPSMEQIRSASTILHRPLMHILGQTSYLAGAEAAVRVIVSDASRAGTDEPQLASDGTVHVDLLVPDAKPRVLFRGHLDQRGTTEAQFRFPAGLTGEYGLHFVAETPAGATETTQNVRLEDKVSILLTTEKPVYQPSQTVHIRALALDRSDEHAAAGRKLAFEIEDSRGNKVFRRSTETDKFGIASAEFTLADEVNLGAYHLRAFIGKSESPSSSAEVTLNVERYVLPKFRVTVDFAESNGKPKRDYRPGDQVTGTVHASYFFGKPLDHAAITVKATGADVAEFEAAHVRGDTDSAGDYHFDLRLPDYFAGTSLAQGGAPVLIEVTVKDGAGHVETRGESITVSRSPLLILAVPESGKLVPGVENQVYLLTSYPDGTPAQTEMKVRAEGIPATKTATDGSGVAVIELRPSGENESLHVEASDRRGIHVSSTLKLESRDGGDQILLRTNRAVFKPGEQVKISVLSTRQHGAAYIDLVRDGQTILTRDVDLVNGHADLSVRATPEMAGTLAIDAYLFGSNAEAVADHRLVFVQAADDLHIVATADAASYLPGTEAQVHLRVTNSHGEGVAAALGLEVVDEAVFALAEKQPGFAKIFFLLEQELMKPRYEIHSLSAAAIVEPSAGKSEQQDRDAQVLFSAAETVNPHTMDTNAGRDLPQEEAADYAARYYDAFAETVRGLAAKLSRTASYRPDDVLHLFATLTDDEGRRPRDAWGTELRLEPMGSGIYETYYRVRSAGPDQQFNTADDMTIDFTAQRDGAVFIPGGGGSIAVRVQHDRWPNNGLAEIAGVVKDPSGAVIPGASIQVRAMADGATRRVVSAADGAFRYAGLPPGKYEISVSALGFITTMRRVELQARDRAVLETVLAVGAVSETVAVMAASPMLDTDNTAFALRAGASAPMAGPVAQNAVIGGAFARGRVAGTPEQQAEGGAVTHVRSYFPEALYVNPEILTDANGSATIGIPLADSITTWRMAMFASTKAGALGSGASSLKVFQDFFVDLDLPVTLTQGDRVSIPVAIYNYSSRKGAVTLSLQPEDWFTLVSDTAEKSISVEAGKVGGLQFTIEAQRIGKFRLTLTARMHGGSDRQDIVVRDIEIVPNGRERDIIFNGRLDSTAEHTIQFPENSIPGAGKIFVRLYPGPLSQVIEGMDAILRMPGGCFEQTSSSTYPNVLALDYMKRNNKLAPEVRAKAEGYIANGYQRLLTFEVPGGGFSWFGQAPANKILTAYGLMEFQDMSRVYDVDPRLIVRTREWLVSQQEADGSWKPDTQFINEGATNRYNSDVLRITAYIAWALETGGDSTQAVAKARKFIADHLDGKVDAYTLAVLANFAAGEDKDSELTLRVLQMLLYAHSEKGEMAWWNSGEAGVYATGESASIETTGLAVQALLRIGHAPEVTRKALAWILSKKGAEGNWGTTQATIMALRALLLASDHAAGAAQGTVEVALNGKTVNTLAITQENNDLLHQFVLAVPEETAVNHVELRFAGSGGMAYQVVGRYFVPWQAAPAHDVLSIDVAYDRTRLAQDDLVTATATVRNNLHAAANMVMVDLGIPPGFDLLSEDLQALVDETADAKKGRLEKFSLTATQAILYFDSIGPEQMMKIPFRLRAKYPIRAKTFESRVYEYYDPAVSATAAPVQFEVTRK